MSAHIAGADDIFGPSARYGLLLRVWKIDRSTPIVAENRTDSESRKFPFEIKSANF